MASNRKKSSARPKRTRVRQAIARAEGALWGIDNVTSIIDAAMDGIISINAKHQIVQVNTAAIKIFGYSKADLIGKPLEILMPSPFAANHRDLVKKFGESGQTVRSHLNPATLLGVRANGEEFPLEITISQIQAEEEKLFTAILRDVSERKCAEEKLRQSEERYRQLIENSSDVIALAEVHGSIIYQSPAVKKILGIDPEKLIGKSTFAGLFPDDAEKAKKLFQELSQTPGATGTFEFRIRHKDGSYRWIEGVATNLLEEKSVRAMVANYRDITDRKHAEETLRATEERFRSVFEQAADGIFIADEQGRYLDVNPSACAMLGYTREELLGQDYTLILLPEDLAQDPPNFELLLDGRTLIKERLYKRKDGTVLPVEISAKLLSGGRIQSLVRDITERKQAQDKVAYQANLLAQVNDAVIAIDLNFVVTSWNQGAEKIYGWTADEIIGQTAEKAFRAEFADKTLAEVRNQIQEEGEYKGEVTQFRKDGARIFIEGHTTALRDNSGAISGYLTVNREITDRKRAEQEIQKRSQQLEALRQIGLELAAELDLTTLLSSIVQRAIPLIGAQTCSCYLLREERQELEQVAIAGGPPQAQNRRMLKRGEGLIGKVWERNEPILVDDYQKWKEGRAVYANTPSRAVMGMPIRWGKKFLGVLVLTVQVPHHFSQNEIELLSQFADQAAIAIQNARLFEETRRRAEQLSTLNEISNVVSARHEITSVLEVIHQQVSRILPLDAFYIALNDDRTNSLTFPLLYDGGKQFQQAPSSIKNGTEINQVIETGEAILLNRTAEEIAAPIDPEFLIADDTKRSASLLFVPLKQGARILGVMSVQSYTLNAYNEEHLALLCGVANQVSVAVGNARLFQDAEQNLQRVQALHQIDRAIASSFDLRLTLNSFLTHVIAQLGIDAANVLTLKPQTQTLEFSSGIGFRTPALQHTHLRLGDGLAGKAALTRENVVITDLAREMNALLDSPFITNEQFVSYIGVPLIAKGRVNGVLEIFHRSPIQADDQWIEYLETLAGQAAIAIDNAQLLEDLQNSNVELALAYDTTLEGWSRALDLRDHETEGHTQRVTEITLQLARTMGIGESDLVHIRRGGLLHDIGKMGIPDEVMLKPGSLTDPEWKVMRQHPDIAFQLLSPITFLKPALDIPYCHHEKWDGTGYPRGLKSEETPLAARIFAIADVWDALTSDRPYRKAWSKEKALEHIRLQSGNHFDPKVVEEFLKMRQKE